MVKKTATGIGEMLGKLMDSQPLAETAKRIDGIQSLRSTVIPFISPNHVSNADLVVSLEPDTDSVDVANSISIDLAERVVDQINVQPVTHPDSLSASSSTGHPVVHTVTQPVDQTVRRMAGQLFSQSVVQTVGQTVNQPVIQTVGQQNTVNNYPAANLKMFADPINGLTKNQCRVLLYLIQQPGITQRPAITENTGIPFGTVKDALALLSRKGFITKPHYYVNGEFRGISYVANRALCDEFLSKRGHEFAQTVSQTVIQTVSQTVSPPDGYSDGQTVAFSSSLFEEKTATTAKIGILDEPELRYWVAEGVTEKQLQSWMAEFGLTPEEMVLSLRYGRFDIVERGDVVQNPQNWFYKIITKIGFYPKPANYRSLHEIRAEMLLEQQKRDKEARALIENNELEIEFQKFMIDTDSPLYKKLLSEVSAFAKDQMDGGEPRFVELEMKELFRNIKLTRK